MKTPKQIAAEKLWQARLEHAVTFPIDHEEIRELVSGLSTEAIAAIAYLPGRAEYIKEAK